jgi:hypothetical protein
MARKKYKRPVARLWSVWARSAKDDGSYWLHFASPDSDRALAEYVALREDYFKVQLRDETNHVVASWDGKEEDEARRQDWLNDVFGPENTVSQDFKDGVVKDRLDRLTRFAHTFNKETT